MSAWTSADDVYVFISGGPVCAAGCRATATAAAATVTIARAMLIAKERILILQRGLHLFRACATAFDPRTEALYAGLVPSDCFQKALLQNMYMRRRALLAGKMKSGPSLRSG